MNIAFWSEEPGCGTTSGMAAVASVCANIWNLKTILMQCGNQKGDLEKLFQPASANVLREESVCYVPDGLDYLLWQARNRKLSEAVMSECMVSVMKERMYYLPQAECAKANVYPEPLKMGMRQIVKKAEQLSDLAFIDCGSGADELSFYVMSRADAVVVCIPQRRQSLDTYFKNRHVFRGKTIYLVNQYQQESVYDTKNLNRIYRIDKEELTVILHNPVFRYACDHGKAGRFIQKHIRRMTLDTQFYFMQQLIRTTYLILRSVGLAEQ